MNNGATILSQIESHLWEAANILRGPVDAADLTCTAALAEIRTKESNLSIPLYVASAAPANIVSEASAPYGRPTLNRALADCLESSFRIRKALNTILEVKP